METLKQVRKKTGLTQVQAARLVGVSRRTFQTYEEKGRLNKSYDKILNKLKELGLKDENPTILNVRYITNKASEIFAKYKEVWCAYLFGSYARGEATQKSDVDILIVSEAMGLKFYGLADELEKALGKSVDLLSHRQLNDNEGFLARFLQEGVKIYGRTSHKTSFRGNS